MNSQVRVRGLRKRYGRVDAVADVSFDVRPDEVFGILGPNGAGKTTTLEIIEGLRRPDHGEVVVASVDVRRDPRRAKARIGVQLQDAGFLQKLTVEETVHLFAAFHRMPAPVTPLLDSLDLTDKRHTLVEALSGGQRQRLSLAVALVNDPAVLFLDEPTTGLDPQARRHLWDAIIRLRSSGRSVVLTTHYMEEAQRLCDRVAIMDHGRIIALGTPTALIGHHARLSTVVVGLEEAETGTGLQEIPGVQHVTQANGDLCLHTRDPLGTLHAVVELRRTGRLRYRSVRLEEPTLEDVFLTLTGRRLRA